MNLLSLMSGKRMEVWRAGAVIGWASLVTDGQSLTVEFTAAGEDPPDATERYWISRDDSPAAT